MQKKIVLINDLSGFGRCSIAVQLPILSVLKAECLLMPTALLSNHTGYPSFYIKDLAEDLVPWRNEWKKLSVHFDAVLSGYISSPRQADEIHAFLDAFEEQAPLYILDPAMDDDGMLYSGLDESIISAMRALAVRSDILLPNLSEACLLSGIPYIPERMDDEAWINSLLERLFALGSKTVVLTGLTKEDDLSIETIVAEQGDAPVRIKNRKLPCSRPGTGDVFAAVFAGNILNGQSALQAAQKAGAFVSRCLQEAMEEQTPSNEGVPFELVLDALFDGERSCN